MAEPVRGSEGARTPLKNIKINRERLDLPNWNGGFMLNNVPGPVSPHRPSRVVAREPGSNNLGWYGYGRTTKPWNMNSVILDAACAAHWIQRASDAEAKGKYQEAVHILEEGKRNSAKPELDIDRALEDITQRWQFIKDYEEKQAAEKVARRLHRSSKFKVKSCASTPCGITQAIPLSLTQPNSSASAGCRQGRKTVTPLPSGLLEKKGLCVQFRRDVEIISATSGETKYNQKLRGIESSTIVTPAGSETGRESSSAGVQLPLPEGAGNCCSLTMSCQRQGPQSTATELQISGSQDALQSCEPGKGVERVLDEVSRGSSDVFPRAEHPLASDVYCAGPGLGSCNIKDAGHTPFMGETTGEVTPQDAEPDASSTKDLLAWMLGNVFSATLQVMKQDQASTRETCCKNEDCITRKNGRTIGDGTARCHPTVEHPLSSHHQGTQDSMSPSVCPEAMPPAIPGPSFDYPLEENGQPSFMLAENVFQPMSSSLQSPSWVVNNPSNNDQVHCQPNLEDVRLPTTYLPSHRQIDRAFPDQPFAGFSCSTPGPRLTQNNDCPPLCQRDSLDGFEPTERQFMSSPVASLTCAEQERVDESFTFQDQTDTMVQLQPTPSISNRHSYSLAASAEGLLPCPAWRPSSSSFGASHPVALFPHTSPSLVFTGSQHSTGNTSQPMCISASQGISASIPRAVPSRQTMPAQVQFGLDQINSSSRPQTGRRHMSSSTSSRSGHMSERSGRGRSSRLKGRSGRS